jgi:zinc transport system substrate-binding protein
MKMIVMNVWRRLVAGPVLLAALLAAGCGTGATPSATAGDKLQVVTALYPFAYVASRVAGEHAEVSSLTQPGAEPHDVELTPRQVASVSTADLVVYEHTFQAAVDEAVAQSGNPHLLDTATVVPLVPLETSSGEEHEAGTGLDPHVWLDPLNEAAIGDAVAARLAAADPAHAADYTANAAALRHDLTGLDSAYRTGLARCARTEFVTTHAAFGYLARRYGLTQVGISGLSPDAEPSPARIAEVQQEVRAGGVTTIFYETLVSPAVARSIAGDLGLVADVLDPIEGITEQSRGADYLAVMRSNLTALEKANGCR